MTSLATTSFHTHSARQFVESLSETANDVYYMFIGRPTPWANGTPTTPDDSVANSAFGFWNDIIAFKRITSNDLTYVIPRYDWVANTQYSMYDHRIPMTNAISNTAHPFYVFTSNNHIFKCIYNGTTNNSSGASNSVSEPSITGQEDITALTYSDGTPSDYIWKYMGTVSSEAGNKYTTSSYIPLNDLMDTLNANGDISDDASDSYDVFNAARMTGNGSIYKIIVNTQGSGYTNPPSIVVTGDGSGLDATANVSSGQVTQINIIGYGNNYTTATVSISANGDSGTGASATAIISPRSWIQNSSGIFYRTNHGINIVDELAGKQVMLYVELAARGDDDLISVGNDYRRIGLIKNPILYGTSTIATSNTYSQTLDLTLSSPSGEFNVDEIVWQGSSNAYGVVIERLDSLTIKLVNIKGTFSNTGSTTILGIGNGNTSGMIANSSITIPATPEAFSPTVAASGATASVSSIAYPDIQPYSGTILYVDHRTPITRSTSQTEIIRTILTF